jgi:hypothetical protein
MTAVAAPPEAWELSLLFLLLDAPGHEQACSCRGCSNQALWAARLTYPCVHAPYPHCDVHRREKDTVAGAVVGWVCDRCYPAADLGPIRAWERL